jgi:GNAT superfamily N-acetyltransferase
MTRAQQASFTAIRGIDAIHESWPLYIDGAILTVRRAYPQDLPAVAMMHNRCSAKSLLDRYRKGGRAPSVITLEHQLRGPMSYAVTSDDGRLIALASLSPDKDHDVSSVEVAILVEDAWQRLGVGRPLLRHLAAVAALSGYRQLIAYPGTATAVVQRLMIGIGSTRMTLDHEDRHLHTFVSQTAIYGLGATRTELDRANAG